MAETVVNKRGAIWQDEEVDALIALWGEEDIQAKLKGTTRNIKVFETIAKKLEDFGFEDWTAVQFREKIKKIKSDYRKTKAHYNRSGSNHKSSRYMEQLDSILGHRPASQPPVVVQSAQQKVNPEVGEEGKAETGGDSLDISAAESLSTGDTSLETASTQDTSLETTTTPPKDIMLETSAQDDSVPQENTNLEGPSSSSKDRSADGEPPCNKETQRKQKRRRQPVDLEKVVGEFQEQQKQSWDKFMEWEEKRMKVEAEDAKRQHQQQQHEMQLFSMLANTLTNPPRWQAQEEFPQYPHYYDQQ